MGVLSFSGGSAVLLVGFAAGIIVDRFRRRPIMIAADLGRAALLIAVPILAFLHLLTLWQLITIAACTGVLTVLFDVAYRSFLPAVVEEKELLDGNRILSLSSATAEILGPSLTGVLVQIISAPFAILFDALSFLVSAGSVSAIRSSESAPLRANSGSLIKETFDGFKVILAHPTLRLLLIRSVIAYLSMGPVFAFYVLYAIRVLHLSTASLGFTISFGGAGAVAGGLLVGPIASRVPVRPSFFLSALLIACTQFFLPLASLQPRFSIALLCVQQFVGDCAWTIYAVNDITLRQSAAPARVLGRVNAAMELASRGMLPLGALAGGYVASSLGMTNALWAGAAGTLLSALCLIPFLSRSKEKWPPEGRPLD